MAIPPALDAWQEREKRAERIGAITRYVTVVLGLIQGAAYFFYLRNNNITLYNDGAAQVFAAIVIILAFTAGTALMMWLGEQINQKGIGNGISILLFAGILARLPSTAQQLWSYIEMANSAPRPMASTMPWLPCGLCCSWPLSGSSSS